MAGSLTGCAGQVSVAPLATGRVDIAAYELRGPGIEEVRNEAAKLCPQGAQVLRQSQSGARALPSAGMFQRVTGTLMATLDPPKMAAQLTILCGERPADRAIPPATVAADAAAPPVNLAVRRDSPVAGDPGDGDEAGVEPPRR